MTPVQKRTSRRAAALAWSRHSSSSREAKARRSASTGNSHAAVPARSPGPLKYHLIDGKVLKVRGQTAIVPGPVRNPWLSFSGVTRPVVAWRVMTWVLGSPTWLGVSACLADVQVTVGDETFDCLQKLYGLERNVLAGFAGNVKTGFAMLATLQRLIDAQKTSQEDPADIRALFQEYPELARDLFARLPEELRHGGSAVLIGAAEPAANTIYGCRSRAACFKSPEFVLEEIPHREWGSIGSGSGIAAYKAELEKITGDEADGLVQMEVGRPGGHAQVMAQFLAMQVSQLPPVPGISSHFHIGVVFADGWQMGTSDRDFFPPDGPPLQIRMPRVASSWAELEALLAGRASGDLTLAIA